MSMYPLAADHHPLSSRRSLNPSLRHPDLIWLDTVLADRSRPAAISSGASPSRNLDTASSSALVSGEPSAEARSLSSARVASSSDPASPLRISWASLSADMARLISRWVSGLPVSSNCHSPIPHIQGGE